MQHLSGTAFQDAAHQQHMPAYVDAGQQTVLPQPLPERLCADGEAFRPGHLLGHLIAGRRFQKNVTAGEPANSRPLRNPRPTIWLLPPTPPLGRLWHPAPPVRHVRATTRQRHLNQRQKAKRRIAGLVIGRLNRCDFLQRFPASLLQLGLL